MELNHHDSPLNFIDKHSKVPLYAQLRDRLRSMIVSGEYAPGTILPPETEYCKQLGVSRHTIRRALSELADEGYLDRTKRKGTFINDPAEVLAKKRTESQLLGLIMPNLDNYFPSNIATGFLRAAAAHEYATIVSISENDHEFELDCIDHLIAAGVCSITLFPQEDTYMDDDIIHQLQYKGINITFIDRQPENVHVDYVGSDNQGGGYTAARHLSMQGYRNVIYCADHMHISSVVERLMGFANGARQYNLNNLRSDIDCTKRSSIEAADFSKEHFKAHLNEYMAQGPMGVFCENDYYAIEVIEILEAAGYEIGKDAAVIGFDNVPYCHYVGSGLTTIAQNGILIGETAAQLAVEKLQSNVPQYVRHILPTQLVVRKSCGEG